MIEEIIQRRQRLIDKLVDNSAIIFFAAPERTRSADTYYPYRQDSNFWYFTGFSEPEAALVLIKKQGQLSQSVLFNRQKDLTAEIWNGRRLGQQAALDALAVDNAFTFEQIEAELPLLFDQVTSIYHAYDYYDFADNIVARAMKSQHKGRDFNHRAVSQLIDWRPIVHEMRLFKSTAEIDLMRKAAQISAAGHLRAMQQCVVGLNEYQLEAELLYAFALQGARSPSFNTIVGGGANGCILHYEENNQILRDGDLVLIDAGAEFQGYAGDITRTFPVNGKFSDAQKAIYQIVLDAQLKAIELLVPGSTIAAANQQVIRIMITGLVKLGILSGDIDDLIAGNAHRQFYMHGLGHWLGLDVHDVGDYWGTERIRPLEPGMVLTVEPGLYIAVDADVPEQYRGIGIRIEDDVLITESGNEVLTGGVPKEIAHIERVMADKGN